MEREVFEEALRAAARVACCAAVFSTGCSGVEHQDPSVPSGAPDAAAPDAAAPDAVAHDAGAHGQQMSEATNSPQGVKGAEHPGHQEEESDESWAACRQYLNEVFIQETKKGGPQTRTCCDKVFGAEHKWQEVADNPKEQVSVESARLATACCIINRHTVGLICTPWGPPTPPAMPESWA
ncbi:MAG: hypothetical protein MK135_03080 [Polyangiaceae bacterium]|nr:hypothetical protein [Polyangiaceae bacterium]